MHNNEKEMTEPIFSKRELLEQQSPEYLQEYRENLLEQYSEIEKEIHLVNDVLDKYNK